MWELDHKESWSLKNWCFQIVVLEKTLQSPLDYKELKSVHPKGNQFLTFLGRTDAEAPVLWPPDEKSWLTGRDPDAVKNWGQEVKGVTEDEIVGWHHWLDGHEFEQTQGDSEGQGSLAYCSPWGRSQTGLTDWTTTCPPEGGSREQWPQPAFEAHSWPLGLCRLNTETNSCGSNPHLSTLGVDEFQRQRAKRFLMYVVCGHRVRYTWRRGQFLPVSLSGPPCLLQGPELPWDQSCESTYSTYLQNYYLHTAEH